MRISVEDAIEDVSIAFQQFEYCLKVNAFWERDTFTAEQFVTDMIVRLPEGDLHFPTKLFADKQNILKASEIAISVAFGCTVLVLDQALETAKYPVDAKSIDEFDQIRCVVYLMRCAFAHRFAQPYWDIRPDKMRDYKFNIHGRTICINAAVLNGTTFEYDHIGGCKVWYDLKDIVIDQIRVKHIASAKR